MSVLLLLAAVAAFDFESGDLQGWKVVSGDLGSPVSELAVHYNSKKPCTKGGRWFLTTLERKDHRPDDGQSGVIESPLVRLTGPKVRFRIGGGKVPTFALVDRASGKTLRTASGVNHEFLRPQEWNVPEAVGRDVFFRVTDPGGGGWMHLTLDDIAFEGTVGAADFAARAAEAAAKVPTEYSATTPDAPKVLVVKEQGVETLVPAIAAAAPGRFAIRQVEPVNAWAAIRNGGFDLLLLHGSDKLGGVVPYARKVGSRAKILWTYAGGNAWSILGSGAETLNLGGTAADRRGGVVARAVVAALGLDPAPPAAFANAERAIRELGGKFPAYPMAAHLTALGALKAEKARPAALEALLKAALVRDNPLVNAHEIAFVTRDQYPQEHHNTATIFQKGEINARSYRTEGALKALDAKTGKVRDIVPLVAGRTVRDPEVDYDGRRIVFSMRNGADDDYHVYAVWSDGSSLRQLTREAGVSDIDPVWLPDGDIVFSSTRNPKYCMCNRHIMCNLYRMRPNGANIHQIGVSTLFEGHATVLEDGRVMYDRWEYVDRDFGDAQGLWVCNQDGTKHAIYWGHNTTSPGGVVNARHLPDGRVIAVLGSCHDKPWGALGIIDRSRGVDGREPVDLTWPRDYIDRIHAGGREDFDSTRCLPVKYADPYPIDSGHFLCARQVGRGPEMAIVYLDTFGNEVVVHEEAPGCHTPVILAARPQPRVQPRQRNFSHPNATGRFLLQDVYVGTHMAGVKRGSIKAIRVVESPEKRSWTGPQGWQGHGEEAPAMNWHSFENKRILGTVPVEADGSAYFEVPANTFVYFQALDAEGKMVQSMRSGAFLQPGELYGCVGCHENRVVQAPPTAAPTIAARRAPSKLDGAYNLRGLDKGTPAHFYSYQREVQPVFDRSCVRCHDYGKPAGEKLNLSGDLGAYFCTSYVDLWALKYVTCAGGGPAETLPAHSWGSHASKLTKTLYGHGGVTLSEDDRDRILTWMDVNAPYYPQYECAYPDNFGGRMPITRAERDELQALSGVKISNAHSANQREQLNFTRPSCSRLLAAITDAEKRAKALAILEKGKARLAQTPRCDMPGFVPCAKDRERECRYQRRLESERKAYEAIRSGAEILDR